MYICAPVGVCVRVCVCTEMGAHFICCSVTCSSIMPLYYKPFPCNSPAALSLGSVVVCVGCCTDEETHLECPHCFPNRVAVILKLVCEWSFPSETSNCDVYKPEIRVSPGPSVSPGCRSGRHGPGWQEEHQPGKVGPQNPGKGLPWWRSG